MDLLLSRLSQGLSVTWLGATSGLGYVFTTAGQFCAADQDAASRTIHERTRLLILHSRGCQRYPLGTQSTPSTAIPSPSGPHNKRFHFILPGGRKGVSPSSSPTKRSLEEAYLWWGLSTYGCAHPPETPLSFLCSSWAGISLCWEHFLTLLCPWWYDVVPMAERTGFVQFLRTLRKLHLSFSFLEWYGRSFASILRVHVKPHWGFFSPTLVKTWLVL